MFVCVCVCGGGGVARSHMPSPSEACKGCLLFRLIGLILKQATKLMHSLLGNKAKVLKFSNTHLQHFYKVSL